MCFINIMYKLKKKKKQIPYIYYVLYRIKVRISKLNLKMWVLKIFTVAIKWYLQEIRFITFHNPVRCALLLENGRVRLWRIRLWSTYREYVCLLFTLSAFQESIENIHVAIPEFQRRGQCSTIFFITSIYQSIPLKSTKFSVNQYCHKM